MTQFPPEPGYDIEGRARPGIRTTNALYLFAGLGLVALLYGLPPLLVFLRDRFGGVSFVQTLLLEDALYYPLMMMLPCALLMRKIGTGAFRLNGISPSMALLCAVTAAACLFLASSVSALWKAILLAVGYPATGVALPISNTNELLVVVFAAAVVPGIFEELLFRGAVLPAYERGGTRRAVYITALLFAVLHGSVEGFPAQFVMGLVLGVAVVSTDSLYAGLMIHTAYNALLVMASYYVTNAVPADAVATAASTLSNPLSLASLAFSALIALAVVIFLLSIFRRYREKHGIALAPRAALRLSAGEVALLILGLLVVAFLYFTSICSAFRGAA